MVGATERCGCLGIGALVSLLRRAAHGGEAWDSSLGPNPGSPAVCHWTSD